MMTLQQLTDNVKAMSVPTLIGDVLQKHGGDIMELQQVQLLEGHNNDGKDMHPFYSEDLQPQGYFKTKETASKYAAWKETLNYPYRVDRNTDAPNLYITGKFHDEMRVQFTNDGVSVLPATPYAADIMKKYGINMFGLSMEKWQQLFVERGVKDEIIREFKDRIYGN